MKKNLFILTLFLFLSMVCTPAQGQIVTTIAGNGTNAFSGDGGMAPSAMINNPKDIAADSAGNIYIMTGSRVRKISTAGIITTVAGTGTDGYTGDGGSATAAQINYFSNICVDRQGNIYLVESHTNRVRKINTAGIITTFAGTGLYGYSGDGGAATAAQLAGANYVTTDTAGNVYIADNGNNRIRKVNTAGIITNYAGTGTGWPVSGDGGPATAAQMHAIGDISMDRWGNLYYYEGGGNYIRKIDASGIITRFAGSGATDTTGNGGPATAAAFSGSYMGVEADRYGNVYTCEAPGSRIRVIDPTGIIHAYAGSGSWTSGGYGGDCGPATAARFRDADYICTDDAGNVYVADGTNRRVRYISVNDTPVFAGGDSQYYAVCVGSSANPLDAILTILDPDKGQSEAWIVVLAPSHGTASVSYSDVSMGSLLAPTGVTYTPSTGYTGYDTFRVKVMDCTGAADTTTIFVSVVSSSSPVTGTATLCVSGTTTLSNAVSGGTWTSGSIGVATVGSASGIVTGISVGTADITYSVSGGCQATTTVTVNPLPATITGTMSACAGSATTLANGTGGGAWSSGATGVATIGSSGTVTGVSAGTAVISYTLPTGCRSTATVTINPLPVIAGAGNVCVSGSATLAVTPAGGTWTSGSVSVATIGSSTGTVTGVSSGTAVITNTSVAGCLGTATVTVNPLPAAITGVFTVCEGGSITLGTTSGGGIWTSGTLSVATIGSSTGVVTGIAAGTATITYTLPTGCLTTQMVTVNPTPLPITGTAIVCAGGSATLAMTPGGGTWSSGSTSIATVGSSSGVVTGVSAGTAAITYTLPTGCRAMAAVTVNATPPAITGTAAVCITATTTLSNTLTGGTWSSVSPGIATIGSTTGVVTGMSAGAAVISYTMPTGCFNTITITVNPYPSAITGASTLCAGVSALFTSSPGGGIWTSGSTAVATVGSSTGVVTGVATGVAGITYTSPAGCAASTTVTVDVSPTAITGIPMMCVSGSTTLSMTGGGGYWTTSDALTADVDISTGVVTGVALGSATITYTMLSSGCYTTTGVTVNTAPTAITGTGTVCPGSTASLFNGVSGGVWSSSAPATATINATTGVYTGVVAGTATITYSMGAGCTATFPITVNAPPGPIAGTLQVCSGSSTPLTMTGPGGTWTSGATTIATIGSATGVVTGVGAGTAPITFTATGTGCTATAVMTVNPLPGTIGGAGAVCVSGSAGLTMTGGGGTWTSNNTAIATVGSTTGIMAGVAAGTATISYTLPTGCRTTRIVTVNALPTFIVGPATVCIGSLAGLTTGSSGGIWTKSNSNVNIGSTTGTVTGVSAGPVTISYVLPTGCYTTKAMTVNSSPGTITGTLGVCVMGSTPLTITGGSGGTWSSSSTTIATIGSATGMVNGIATGTATITYTVGSGCFATATVTVNPLPTAWSVSGGGGYCAGGPGLHIGLSGSNIGVSYQLYVGGTPIDAPLAGTGGSLDFGFQTTAGTYTVTAINTTTGCTRPMTGSAVMVINLPPATPSGPSAVCVGATGTLTSSPGSGIWTSASPGTATIGSTTGLVTGTAIGTAVITYTLPTTCYSTTTMTVSTAPTAISGSGTVCVADATLLTNGVSGGVWSSSATTIATVGSLTGAVVGVSAGVANITYSLGAGCTVTKIMTVIAAPAPITGSMNVCEAATTVLTSATTGGTWTSGSTTTATVGSTTGIVTGVAAGTAIITYTAGGCNTTATVTVHPIPGAITGSAQVCVSGSTTLTTIGSGGTWSSSSTAIATIGSSTGIVNGITAGTATITYSVGGCMTTRAITVNAIPVITGAAGLCVAGSTALTTGGSGTWTSGSTGIATVGATTGIVTGIAAGTAPITFTPATGCIAIKTVTVNTTPTAIGGTTQVCVLATTTLTNGAGGGTWTSGATGTATIGSSTGVVTGVAAGTAAITYSLGSGCTVYTNVTVNALPAPISGTAVFCAGSTSAMSVGAGSGVWTSNNMAIATVGSGSGIVTGVAAGTATISYTLPTGCAVKKDVTVTPLPSAITGSTQVCMSGTTTLSNPVGGGTWSSSNPVIAAIGSATGIVTGSSIGTATITYSLGPGCTTTIIMTVQPLPAGITGGTNICVGATTTLSSPTTGGTWSTASTNATVGSSTGIVTGTAGGAAIISYTLPTGCAATHTVSVIAVPAITGLHNMCAWGDTMTIHNIISGGAYSSTWVTVLNLGGGAGRVTAGAPGTATITYMIPAGCSTTATITVNPLPSPITGATDLCIGTTGTLSNATPGGAWSSSNTTTATIVPGTGAVSALAAGTTIMRYMLPTGCMVDTLLTVSVPPVAGTISGAAQVCTAGSTTLTVTGGSTSGVWTSTNIAIATIGSSTGIVTGVTAGTVTISYTITNACGTAATGKALTVNPSPNAGTITGADSVCVGSTLLLTNMITGGVWSTTTGRSSVSASGTVTGLTVGTDTVRYTVTDGTCTSVAKKPIKVLPNGSCGPTALSSFDKLRMTIRPNPANDHIIITTAIDDMGDVTMIIYDMVGRKQMEQVLRFSGKEVRVPLELVPGVYIVELRVSGERGVYRVVVE